MHIHANGTDIHYVDAGKGPPLLLLHGGLMSTSDLWAGHPGSYVSRMTAFTEHFRVIALDTRGHGQTANTTRELVTYAQLADDVIALVGALDLHRPAICGFSDGGFIGTVAAIKAPSLFRAVVNDAGFDFLDPQSPSFAMVRQMMGGSPTATTPDYDAFQRALSSPQMGGFFDRVAADHGGNWKTMLAAGFGRLTTSTGYTVEDLRKITAPTLILTGDRDMCCSVEEAVAAFRVLAKGELAILPGQGHYIPDSAIAASAEFLRRHAA
jgi:pimeloyl-ACP methyl ester carboxylesterase